MGGSQSEKLYKDIAQAASLRTQLEIAAAKTNSEVAQKSPTSVKRVAGYSLIHLLLIGILFFLLGQYMDQLMSRFM